ncbi:hypothetical protein B0T16DRAFT_411404 [Cercophora newfieldiana]|uniref:Uncharacterized protein n=1 Tax=Cercophora newfieldiana TaxID=92897 RepID=A0AA39Y617_9PEZI|nr:hypothetical protein B0T16DRAFT_411404 [Cercophora newfieldiana]
MPSSHFAPTNLRHLPRTPGKFLPALHNNIHQGLPQLNRPPSWPRLPTLPATQTKQLNTVGKVIAVQPCREDHLRDSVSRGTQVSKTQG